MVNLTRPKIPSLCGEGEGGSGFAPYRKRSFASRRGASTIPEGDTKSILPSLYKRDEFPGKYVCSMMDSLIILIKPYLTLFSVPIFVSYAGEAQPPLADEMG
jgi:hypothetical protein